MSDRELSKTAAAGGPSITRELAPMLGLQNQPRGAQCSLEDRWQGDVAEVERMLIRVPPNPDCAACQAIGAGHTCPACVVETLAEKYPDATEEEVRATLLGHRPTLVNSVKRWIASLLRNA